MRPFDSSTGVPGMRGQRVGHERHHGAKKDCSRERRRLEQQQAGRDVRAVREADRNHLSSIETVMGAAPARRSARARASAAEIVEVEHAFGESAEEARHAALEHLARAD